MTETETQILSLAREILARRFRREAVTSAEQAAALISHQIGLRDRECLIAIFLDSRNRLISAEELFMGSLAEVIVHPREVARAALRLNASAVILGHNHPSGDPTPSTQDRELTSAVASALALIDVRLVDHLVVAGVEWRRV